MESVESRVLMELEVWQDQRVTLGLMATLDGKDTLVCLVHQVYEDPREPQGKQDSLVER